MRRVIYISFIATLVLTLLGAGRGPVAEASISACVAQVSQHKVETNSVTDFQFQLTNNDSSGAVSWFKVPQLAGYFDVQSAGATGWGTNVTADEVIFSGGALPAGQTMTFTIRAKAAAGPTGQVYWNVQVSDNGGASGPYCDGDTSSEVVDPQAPQVSDVTLSNLTTQSVTIAWTTDIPGNSVVNYGKTDSYGQVKTVSGLRTSHSVTLTGLTANTPYHYQVASTNGAGTGVSNDNTFLTALSQSAGPSQTPVTSGSGALAPIGQPTETTPPVISLDKVPAQPVKAAPKMTGKASDNAGVAKVEYSIDGGKNWVGADKVTPVATRVSAGSGKRKVTTTTTDNKNVTFEFTPVIIEDGNYEVLARVSDTSGNVTKTPVTTLIIDRLPPRLGAEVIAFGNQAAQPDEAGRWQAVVDVDQTVTVNAVGGPVGIALTAKRDGVTSAGEQTFTLRRDTSSGLWSGVVALHSAGVFNLTAVAVDGAGNQTETALADMVVLPSARVSDPAGNGIKGAKVTLYYRLPKSGEWVVWDGKPYGQDNPQRTGDGGAFALLVPAGTYYLKVERAGYKTVVTRQFSLQRATALATQVHMKAPPRLVLGPITLYLPWWSLEQVDLHLSSNKVMVKNDLISKPMPDFNLPNTAGGTTTGVGLLGKLTVVSVISTWGPSGAEQLLELDKLHNNRDINVVPLVLGERVARVQSYLALGGYGVPAAVDTDATLSATLGAPNLPTHYILDRRGKVKAVLVGTRTEKQLLEAMTAK